MVYAKIVSAVRAKVGSRIERGNVGLSFGEKNSNI